MNTFFKTFFVCLFLCLSFIGYKYVSSDSYSPEISISDSNHVFSKQVSSKPALDEPETPIGEEPVVEKQTENQKQEKPKNVQYNYTCYFYSNEGKLMPYYRTLPTEPKLETAVSLLLKGPLLAETKQGVYTEIPANTDVIYIKRNGNKIIVNLTSRFGDGGGSQSIENRLKQLTKTIKTIEPKKSIYLYINGAEVEYLGGDGVYVKQPL